MSKEKTIEKIQYAAMQIASVYTYSAIFNEKMIEFYKRMIHCHENRIKEKRNLKE